MLFRSRKAIDWRRRAPRHANHLDLAEVDVEDTRDRGPERLAIQREARRVFDAIVAGVDEPYRTVYLLSEVDELQVPEIAHVLEIPVGTAASRLKRGRAAFDAGLARARAAEQRRAGAAMLPMWFTNPRTIHDAGRALPSITADAAAKLWGKVTATVAVAGAAAAAGAGAGAGAVATVAKLVSLTHGQLLAYFVTTAIAAGTFGGVLVFAATHATGPHAALPVVVAEPARTGPAGGPALDIVATDPSPRSTSSPAAPIAATTTTTTTDSPVAPSGASTERAEMALLDLARGDLARGDTAGALRELERHRRTYPRGVYRQDRDAMIQRATSAAAGQDGGSK